MGGVGARPTAWPEAAAAFSPLADNPVSNKSAVAIIQTKAFRARCIAEPPDSNSLELPDWQRHPSASVWWNRQFQGWNIMK
jgi:hypothetical protein